MTNQGQKKWMKAVALHKEGWSVNTIAKQLNTTPNNVKSMVSQHADSSGEMYSLRGLKIRSNVRDEMTRVAKQRGITVAQLTGRIITLTIEEGHLNDRLDEWLTR